jgi:hypothetical protein
MKHPRIILALLLLSSLAWEGCGGKNNKPSPGSPPPHGQAAQVSVSLLKGSHSHAVSQTKKTSWKLTFDGLVPSVEAATTTVVNVAQNWDGLCSSNPVTSGPASIVVFGIGQSEDATCSHEFTLNDSSGQQAATNATSGKLVTGDGTLSNLVVNTEKGTDVATAAGVPVTVYVRRGATILPTGLSCTLPQGGDELICASTATFAVLNGDRVLTTVSLTGNDTLVNLNVTFTKSIP